MSRGLRAAVIGAAWVAAACGSGTPAALDPAGPQAAHIEILWWILFGVSLAVYVVVLAGLAWGVLRRRRPEADEERRREERGAARVVGAAVVVTALLLFVLLVSSIVTGRSLARLERSDALTIEVIGHRWWWEIVYPDSVPARRVVTANEIHVPTGRPVHVVAISRDVIHSLWIPEAHGKLDLLPDHRTTTWLRVDRPGRYPGRCAEFCGHQHARMGLVLVAEPPARFEAWLERQRRPALPPGDSVAARGQRVFLSGPCVMCHTIRGTEAGGRVGPELTHLADRGTIAAATLPNTKGHLSAWVLDPQRIKAGTPMPATALSSRDLEALVAYLRGLR